MVPTTLAIPAFFASFTVISLLSSRIMYSKAGTMANQPMKAMKKDSQLK